MKAITPRIVLSLSAFLFFCLSVGGWHGIALAAALDWRDDGAVNDAKDQGDCDASWAFAATSVFESKILIAGYASKTLSPQQLISCSDDYAGCSSDGGPDILEFWTDTGPMLESCTGYASEDGSEPDCEELNTCSELPYRTTGYYTVSTDTVTDVQSSVSTDGPGVLQFDYYSDFDTFWRNNESDTVYTQASGDKKGVINVALIGYSDAKEAWLCLYSKGATAGPNNDGTFWLAYEGHTEDLNMQMGNVLMSEISIGETQPDLIINNASTGVNYIYYLDEYYLTDTAKIKNSLGWTIVGVGDFNGDDYDDILLTKADTGKSSVWLMEGATYDSTVALNDVATTWSPVAVADFNEDGDSDILWRNSETGKNVIWFMDGTAWEDFVVTENCDTDWTVGGTGDFDGDGVPDIFWRNSSSGSNAIWHMNSDGSLSDWEFTESVRDDWSVATINDFDGDGAPEVLWSNSTTGKNVIWVMDDTELINWFFIEDLDVSWNIAASGVFH